MNEKIAASLKSSETEDWLDLHVVRPFSYSWASFFNRFDIHPNTVTIWSMFVGAGSSLFFASGSFYYAGITGLLLNIVAILLLCVADVLDCADGQLARISGKKTRLGRILDGVAGFTWFLPIYVVLVWRFYVHHDLEFSWLGLSDTPQTVLWATVAAFFLALASGIYGIAGQQRLADYYIQAHLFFLKGEKGSELDNSEQQQRIYDEMPADTSWVERLFQHSYIGYTKKQELRTPQFQRLLKTLRERYGSAENIPAEIRKEFHDESLRIIPLNGLLTFNFRSFWLFLFCLADIPVVYFLFEFAAMGLFTCYINHRHESFCRKIADKL